MLLACTTEQRQYGMLVQALVLAVLAVRCIVY